MSKGMKTGLIITGIVLAVLTVGSFIGRLIGWRGTGWGMMVPWMGGYGGMWVMPLLMVVFWGLIIWGIVAFVRFGISGSCMHHEPAALETLKTRYAHGEISKQEYEEKKKDLA